MNVQGKAGAGPAPGLSLGEKVVVLVGGILAAMALTVINPVLPNIEKELARSALSDWVVRHQLNPQRVQWIEFDGNSP